MIEELAHVLLPKTVKVVAAIVASFGGNVLLGLWVLVTLMKSGLL
jgi:hypothetical protein